MTNATPHDSGDGATRTLASPGWEAHLSPEADLSPEAIVADACPKIAALGSAFYFTPETTAKGQLIGLDPVHFYFLGRGGVLGDVDARVVSSAFGYFEPGLISRMWEEGRSIVAPRDAGRAHIEACREFGRMKLSGIEDLDTFCTAAEAVNQAADPAGLALYAGISAEPLPEEPAERAMQLVAVLRELRGSMHLLSVVATGLVPSVAHRIHRPDFLALFGWSESTVPEPSEADREKLERAERLTDELIVPAYSAMPESLRDTFLRVLEDMKSAISAQP